MTKTRHNDGSSSEWLNRMADMEDSCPSISAGGGLTVLKMQTPINRIGRFVVGRVIEFTRRDKGWSIDKLSHVTDVDRSTIAALEKRGHCTELTIIQVARALGLPSARLLELARLTKPRHDDQLRRAAIRFSTRSKTTAPLTQTEREALDEFVEVLAEDSD